jgi:exportin-2 (importin alpha re-exporter)
MIVEADVDDLGFGVGFTQLNTCKKVPKDEWPEVTDVKSWVGSFLKAADGRQGGAIGRYVSERLSPEARSVLVSYMK